MVSKRKCTVNQVVFYTIYVKQMVRGQEDLTVLCQVDTLEDVKRVCEFTPDTRRLSSYICKGVTINSKYIVKSDTMDYNEYLHE